MNGHSLRFEITCFDGDHQVYGCTPSILGDCLGAAMIDVLMFDQN